MVEQKCYMLLVKVDQFLNLIYLKYLLVLQLCSTCIYCDVKVCL